MTMTMDRSESDGSRTGESSRRSSFLGEDLTVLDGIERRVNELALGGGGGVGGGRRALSEGSTFAGNGGGGAVVEEREGGREGEGGAGREELPSISEISKREGNRSCVDCGRASEFIVAPYALLGSRRRKARNPGCEKGPNRSKKLTRLSSFVAFT